jgi:hypothetical protein
LGFEHLLQLPVNLLYVHRAILDILVLPKILDLDQTALDLSEKRLEQSLRGILVDRQEDCGQPGVRGMVAQIEGDARESEQLEEVIETIALDVIFAVRRRAEEPFQELKGHDQFIRSTSRWEGPLPFQ